MPISRKVHFWPQNGPKTGFCRRVKGVEVQKVNFLGLEGPLLGGTAPPKINPGYEPESNTHHASCILNPNQDALWDMHK